MDVFLLLDRTGSMKTLWDEAVSSLNSYVETFQKSGGAPDDRVTLVVFDRHNGLQFDVLRSMVRLEDWKPLDVAEVSPRGDTPLFDALQRIILMAEGQNQTRTVIVVMTDGQENASHEVTREEARVALERVKARGWQVVFLGANFDAFGQAVQVGIGRGQTLSAAPGFLQMATTTTAVYTAKYRTTGEAIAFTDADRAASNEASVTKDGG